MKNKTKITNENIHSLDFSKITYAKFTNELLNENIELVFNMLVKYNFVDTLVCKNNNNIVEIPLLSNLKFLNISGCSNIRNIPILPSLYELYCNNCIGITNISLLPQLSDLYCNKCINLSNISLLPNLSFLSCHDCISLTNLSTLSNINLLYCRGCINLINLPESNKLVELDCRRCENLTNIPILPNLECLDFCDCPKLNKWTVDLRHSGIDKEILSNIDKYIEYNNNNLEYLKDKIKNWPYISDDIRESAKDILISYNLVKPAKFR